MYLDEDSKGIPTSLTTKARLYPGVTLGPGAAAAAGLFAYSRARR